jgi:hypothetical protein
MHEGPKDGVRIVVAALTARWDMRKNIRISFWGMALYYRRE